MVERHQLTKDIHVKYGDEYRCIELYVVENGTQRKIDLKDVNYMTSTDGSWVAEVLLMRLMMRAANLKLKNTPFEKVPWEEYTEGERCASDTCYIKRIDANNYAYVMAEYFYMT